MVWRFGLVVAYFHCKRANQFSFPHTTTNTQYPHRCIHIHCKCAHVVGSFVGVFVMLANWQGKKSSNTNDYTRYTISAHTTQLIYHTQRILRLQHLLQLEHKQTLHTYTCTLAYVHAQAIPTLIGFVYAFCFIIAYKLQYHTFLLENSSCFFLSFIFLDYVSFSFSFSIVYLVIRQQQTTSEGKSRIYIIMQYNDLK